MLAWIVFLSSKSSIRYEHVMLKPMEFSIVILKRVILLSFNIVKTEMKKSMSIGNQNMPQNRCHLHAALKTT